MRAIMPRKWLEALIDNSAVTIDIVDGHAAVPGEEAVSCLITQLERGNPLGPRDHRQRWFAGL